MSGNTKLKGRPIAGDQVQWTLYDQDLVGAEYTGIVQFCTGEASLVKSDCGDNYLYPVPHAIATVIISTTDLADYLVQQMKMISSLEQGCGGNATPAECWRQAKGIALDAIARLT